MRGGKSTKREKMGNEGGFLNRERWRMEPWDGRCRLVGLASGSVYRKQMGYACSTPYFTRIYCLLFRGADDIGPCLPGVSVNVVNSSNTPVPRPPLELREPNQGQTLGPWDYIFLCVNEYTSELRMLPLLGDHSEYGGWKYFYFLSQISNHWESLGTY